MRTDIDEVLDHEDITHCCKQQRIRARPDRNPLISFLRRARAPGIDDNNLSTTLADALDSPWEIRSGTHAAVRYVRVGTKNQEMLSAIQVGYRYRHRRPKNAACCDVAWHLIYR